MRKVQVLSTVTLTAGVLALSTEQAEARAHLVKPAGKKGQFEIVQPVTFKTGEVFGIAELLDKHALEHLAEPGASRSLAAVERDRAEEQRLAALKVAQGDAAAAVEAVRAEFKGRADALRAAFVAAREAADAAAAAAETARNEKDEARARTLAAAAADADKAALAAADHFDALLAAL